MTTFFPCHSVIESDRAAQIWTRKAALSPPRCRHSGPRPSLFDVPPSPTLANLKHSYQIDPDLSIMKVILLFLSATKMRLECAQGGNKDTRRRLLANPSPIPTLLERPFLQRPFPP